MYHIFLNEKLWTGQKTGTQKNNKLNFVFRAYFIALICSLYGSITEKENWQLPRVNGMDTNVIASSWDRDLYK